jgi:hypothetical protein
MTCFLVELYAPRGITRSPYEIKAAIATAGVTLRYLRTILLPADETCFCLIEAPCADVIARLAETAGIEIERIVETAGNTSGDLV